MGALMYYPLGGKSVILCGVFMANKAEMGASNKKLGPASRAYETP